MEFVEGRNLKEKENEIIKKPMLIELEDGRKDWVVVLSVCTLPPYLRSIDESNKPEEELMCIEAITYDTTDDFHSYYLINECKGFEILKE